MTAEELRSMFNRVFGLSEWPKTFEVDADTYANCCQAIFENESEDSNQTIDVVNKRDSSIAMQSIRIMLGQNKGLMFKGVELILHGRKTP